MTRSHDFARLYLIGMTGVGKSTIARLLAQRMGWIWIDTDACVERSSCMTIADIFAHYGEDEFRRREWGCVKQTVKSEQIVVACGGGAPCHNAAIELMLSSGIVVYIYAGVESLIARLSMGEQVRPLLSNPDISLKERLNMLVSDREPVYRRAHFSINTDGMAEGEVADKIFSFDGITKEDVFQALESASCAIFVRDSIDNLAQVKGLKLDQEFALPQYIKSFPHDIVQSCVLHIHGLNQLVNLM